MLLDTQALKVVNSEQNDGNSNSWVPQLLERTQCLHVLVQGEALAQFCALADGHPYIHFTDEEIKA